MRYRTSTFSYRAPLFWILVILTAFFLIAYIYFIYLAVHFSFAIDQQQKALLRLEQNYQEQEETYLSAISAPQYEDDLAKGGFQKIASPQYLSRTISVALQEE